MTATNIAMPFYLPDSGQILPPQTELTPEQAAEFLCVSESLVFELLDSGEIESRKVGTQRMVALSRLAEYEQETKRIQRIGLAELTQDAQELGLY